MDTFHAERVFQNAMQILADQLGASALHAAGLHDHRVAKRLGVLLGEIQ